MNIKYSDYQAVFGDLAKIPEACFDLWIQRSIFEVDRYLFVPVLDVEPGKREFCIIEVAEYLFENSEKVGIKSENTDGYSVTYTDKSGDEVSKIIRRYLGDYIYRGVL